MDLKKRTLGELWEEKYGPIEIEIDLLVKALTPKQLQKDIAEFESLLDDGADERVVHDFLANHSYFFNRIICLNGWSPLYSKIRLGSQFEIDFACFESGSHGPEWCLIEIERPGQPLFTKSGNPSAKLTHAIQQVRDWHQWIHENLDYVRKLLPHIEYPLGFVFMGRRSDLTPTTQKKLKRINYEHRLSLEVHSLDWFASTARGVANLVKRKGGGDWLLPMKALTHKDLSKGLPPLVQKYMDSYSVDLMDHYHNKQLEEREMKGRDVRELDDEEIE